VSSVLVKRRAGRGKISTYVLQNSRGEARIELFHLANGNVLTYGTDRWGEEGEGKPFSRVHREKNTGLFQAKRKSRGKRKKKSIVYRPKRDPVLSPASSRRGGKKKTKGGEGKSFSGKGKSKPPSSSARRRGQGQEKVKEEGMTVSPLVRCGGSRHVSIRRGWEKRKGKLRILDPRGGFVSLEGTKREEILASFPLSALRGGGGQDRFSWTTGKRGG